MVLFKAERNEFVCEIDSAAFIRINRAAILNRKKRMKATPREHPARILGMIITLIRKAAYTEICK